MLFRRLLTAGALIGATLVLPSLSCSTNAGSACDGAGGSCVSGGERCANQAPSSAQDCNPDDNPGGFYCCLGGASAPGSPASSDEAGACLYPTLGCGEFDPSDAAAEPIVCDPDASDPCDPGKDNNPCVTFACDPNQRVCVWVPVEPPPPGCVGADAAAEGGDAASAGDAGSE
jgi:hypothetical protein